MPPAAFSLKGNILVGVGLAVALTLLFGVAVGLWVGLGVLATVAVGVAAAAYNQLHKAAGFIGGVVALILALVLGAVAPLAGVLWTTVLMSLGVLFGAWAAVSLGVTIAAAAEAS